jgi:hypothetical protein
MAYCLLQSSLDFLNWYKQFKIRRTPWFVSPLESNEQRAVLWQYIQPLLVKVKCNLVQALRLCTSRTAHRGSRGIALLFHDYGNSRGWGVNFTSRPLFTPGKDPVLIVQEAEWAPGLVWTGVENLASTGIRSPDFPARSQSLYRLSYPANQQLLSNA